MGKTWLGHRVRVTKGLIYGLGLGLGLGGWYLPSGSTGGQHVVGSGAIVAQHLGGR